VNLSAIRDRVRALTGIRLDTLRSDEQIDAVINESYHEIINLSPWPFLASKSTASISADQEEFNTPTGFSEVSSVYYQDANGNRTRLQQTSFEELDRLDEQGGDPLFYARIDENTFQIWPVPESSMTFHIRGKQSVQNLSADSSEPIFGEQFHPVLAYRSASKILAEEADDSNRSELYQNEAGALFAQMQQFYNKANDKGMFVMGGRGQRRRTLDAD